jgi:hypothetical protein
MIDMRIHRRTSQDIASLAKRRRGEGRPTARWQDKSREVRGGRSAAKEVMIKDLAQCVQAHESLPIRTSDCKYRQERTSRFRTR